MRLDFEFMQETFLLVWSGAGTTLSLTALVLLVSIPLGFYLAAVRLHSGLIISSAVRGYVSFVRGTPIILQILLVYSLLPSLLNAAAQAAGLSVNIFDLIEPFWYAAVVFTLNTTALLTEVFRSSLTAIPKGQLEAGLTCGMSAFKTYLHIIVPQALAVALPGLCNATVNLVKGTSLAFLMTVKDIMAVGKIAASYGYNYLEAYLDVFLVYLILCTIIQLGYAVLEARLSTFRAKL
ncbi:MAG: amino acid ABC transporter permease [Anaerovibrio sp.]|nr:amino acid ABC transporter permease [Anaerovibrio sp.]